MKVILVTPLNPANRFNGASQRINRVIRTLKLIGLDTHIVYTCQDISSLTENRARTILDKLHFEFGNASLLPSKVKISNDGRVNALDDYFPADIIDEFKVIIESEKPICVMVNYVFLSGLLEYIPKDIYKVIDTHDKLSRENIYKSAGLDLGFFCTTEKEELRGLKRGDLVICIQENERRYFKESGIKDVITIGHSIEKAYLDRKTFVLPKKVGFLGSNHIFNSKSIEMFLNHNRFREASKEFDFVLAGGICNNDFVKNSGAIVLGRVDKEINFYKSVDIVLNPVVLGTGLKIKTIESMAYGVPVVGTKIAFDGIPTESPFHLAGNIDAIYDLLDQIHYNPGEVLKLSNLSKSLFEEYRAYVMNGYRELLERISSHSGSQCISNDNSSKKIIIHHVINAVEVNKDSDLYLGQPITFKSLSAARAYVNATQSGKVDVKHHVVLVNKEQCSLSFLEEYKEHRIFRTIRDYPGFESFKPLPMLKDIFNCMQEAEKDDYVVFTNADISLTPIFYEFIYEKIKLGHDALIINRRTLSMIYSHPEEYPDMVADMGQSHPGYDCFVFKVSALRNFLFSNTLIGIHMIGRVLLWNIIKHSERPLLLRESHLTFHIGDDNAGKDEMNNILLIHNFKSALEVLDKLHDEDFEIKMRNVGPDALKFFFRPNIFRDELSEKKQPVFIHSMFRTGSSYVWGKLNAHRGAVCYYEPLHEMLAGLTVEKQHAEGENTEGYHKRLKISNCWENYRTLLNRKSPGVRLYDRRFAYFDYTNTDGHDYGLKDYITELIECAKDRRPIFQFNRTALRQQWFLREFPESVNIYLLREARSQFNSYYSSFLKSNGRGFIRTDLAIVDQNINSDAFNGLKKIISMPEVDLGPKVSIKNFFETYDIHIEQFNPRQQYLMFFWHWLQSLISAIESSSEIFNTTKMSKDLLYRRKRELFLARNFFYMDFDDCKVPEKISDVLSPIEYDIIEKKVVTLNREKLLNHLPILQEHGIENVLISLSTQSRFSSLKKFSDFVCYKSPVPALELNGKKTISVPINMVKCKGKNVTIAEKQGIAQIEVSGSLELKIPIKIENISTNSHVVIYIRANQKNFNNNSPFLSLSVNGKRHAKVLTKNTTPVLIEDITSNKSNISLALKPENEDISWNLDSISYSTK